MKGRSLVAVALGLLGLGFAWRATSAAPDSSSGSITPGNTARTWAAANGWPDPGDDPSIAAQDKALTLRATDADGRLLQTPAGQVLPDRVLPGTTPGLREMLGQAKSGEPCPSWEAFLPSGMTLKLPPRYLYAWEWSGGAWRLITAIECVPAKTES